MCYTNRQYDARVRKLMDLEALKQDLQKQIDAIEADIKADMGDTEIVETANYRITWQTIFSKRFDSKAFKAAHEKLYNQFVKSSESKRFTVKAMQ